MIQIESLDYAYQKPLFEALSVSLKAGHIYGLLGKNGAGKTTLLKLLAGLLLPKAGRIEVCQQSPGARDVTVLQHIYFLPDTFALPKISMQQFLNAYAVFYPAFNYDEYASALKAFELDETKKLATLSHGQQKKFLLAFGFATGAKVVLLDEPTNGLDIPSKQQFRKLVASQMRSDRMFMISTHQVQDIEHLVDSVVILDEGKIIFNQTHEAADWSDLESLFQAAIQGELS